LLGRFVVLEGPDGSGKSTVARELARLLAAQGETTVLTREPGGTELGKVIRELLLDRHFDRHPFTELLLMCADRAEHVRTVIVPALERGDWVISDRYAGSTRAYQGAGLGLDRNYVEQCIQIATGGIEPDLTLLLDVASDVARLRRQTRTQGQNDIDQRSVEFHERVRAAFLDQARTHPESWVVIDAAQSLDQVTTQVRSAVLGLKAAKALP
jgi:dTMP kinase